MPTLERIACECCQKPLTGGADTFGGIGQTLCFTCLHDLPSPAKLNRLEHLKALLSKLELQYDDAEDEYHSARSRMDELDKRIAGITNELNGHGKCDEEVEE